MDNSPFNKLSAELRNSIYNLVMVSDNKSLRIGNDSAKQPPITRVCKQIRSECLFMFYAQYDFCITIITSAFYLGIGTFKVKAGTTLWTMNNWLGAISKPAHLAVKTLTIFVLGDSAMMGAGPLANRGEWELLASQLKECGYRKPRLQVEVVVSRAYTSRTHVELWRNQADSLKNMLCDCGLDAVMAVKE